MRFLVGLTATKIESALVCLCQVKEFFNNYY